MKKLSDYTGDEAIELWADLLEPLSRILGDKEIANTIRSKKPKMIIAKAILKYHKADAEQILLRIDPEPLNGINVIVRLLSILSDIGQNEDIKGFFALAEQAKTENESFGSVTESTEVNEI